MKKTVIFILFVLSMTLANAQRPVESAKLEKLNLKPIESVDDEQLGRVDKDDVVGYALNEFRNVPKHNELRSKPLTTAKP